jgi:homoserine dehydrogenase
MRCEIQGQDVMLDMPIMTDPRVVEFRERVEAFLLKTGMKKTRLGTEVNGDPLFVDQLRDGREPKWTTMKKFDEYMRKYKG